MPTAYTDGILTGKIKSFPKFATQCMRAFGATIHMKEESFDKGYTPRVPGDYHTKGLAEGKKQLKLLSVYPDRIIVALANKKLMESKTAYINYIKKAEQGRKKLLVMKSKIAKWTPPTDDHLNFKKFMLEQIDTTIQHDGDSTYWKDELDKIEQRIKEINAETSRKEMIEKAKNDVEYHTEKLDEEIKRCNFSNKWVNELLKSLK